MLYSVVLASDVQCESAISTHISLSLLKAPFSPFHPVIWVITEQQAELPVTCSSCPLAICCIHGSAYVPLLLSQFTNFFLRDLTAHKGESEVKVGQREIWKMLALKIQMIRSQAKGSWQPPEAGRSGRHTMPPPGSRVLLTSWFCLSDANFRILASKTVRQYISVVVIHSVCGDLLQLTQETVCVCSRKFRKMYIGKKPLAIPLFRNFTVNVFGELLSKSLLLKRKYIYIYIYICMYVCVCVCVYNNFCIFST